MSQAIVNVALVGAGGFVGSVLRYGVGLAMHRAWPHLAFPLGTLVVNVAGCFVIGALAAVTVSRTTPGHGAWLFLVVGLLGGFTTFSTYGLETFVLLREGHTLGAVLNVCLNATSTIAAVAVGYYLARML